MADVFSERTVNLVSSEKYPESEENRRLNLNALILTHEKDCEHRMCESALVLLTQAIDYKGGKLLPLDSSILLLKKAYNKIANLSGEEPSKLRLSILSQLGPRLVVRDDEKEEDLILAVTIWKENPDAGIFTLPTLRQLAQSLILRNKQGDLDEAIEILEAINFQLDRYRSPSIFKATVKSDLGAGLAIRSKKGDVDQAIPILKDGLQIIQQLEFDSIHAIEKGIAGALGASYLKKGIKEDISNAIGFLKVATTPPYKDKATTVIHFRKLWIALSRRNRSGDLNLRIDALRKAVDLETDDYLKFDDLRRLVLDVIERSVPGDLDLIIKYLEETIKIAPNESLKALAEEELSNVLHERDCKRESETNQKPQLRLPPK